MTSEEKECPQGQGNDGNVPPTEQHTARTYIHEYPAEDLREALLPLHQLSSPLEELIATGEAAFEFIRNAAHIDMSSKHAFCQLEKQFDFYKNLIVR